MYLAILMCLSISVAYSHYDDSTKTSTKISGYVKDGQGKPLNAANVVIEGTIDGATTDSTGYYEFETEKTGARSLIATAIEYKEKFYNLNIESGKNITQNIILSQEEVRTDEIIVTASSYTSGQNSQVTMTPLEIVRIPGSDADLYRAITTFPGANQVDEGSKLSVRGGDPSEVLTILDQASLYNPFIFDDDFNTSTFSTVDPWSLRGISFTSGGFSAKFGNALSAVLDLKSYEMPQQTGSFIFLGLANGALAGSYLTPDKKFGATLGASTTILDPYFKINGTLGAEYSPIPLAQGFGGTLSYDFGKGKYLKFYTDYAFDKIGIRNTSPSYDGYFNDKTKNTFSNLKYSSPLFGPSAFEIGLSYSRHIKDMSYGVLNSASNDIYSKLRLDFTTPLKHNINLSYGGEYEYNEGNFNGTVPLEGYNLRLNAPSYYIDSRQHTGRFGSYFESQFKFTKNFFTIAGIRGDYHTLSKKYNIDPRLSIGYNFIKDNVIRAAVGLYHQYPDLTYYAQSTNNELKPEQAIHYILGYELNKMDGLLLFRVEAYYKDYKNLVKLDSTGYFNYNYNSTGTGRAKGVDVFLKSKITNRYSAWISYAYTDSKRNYLDYNAMTSADYDITHSLTLVGSFNITDNLVVGTSYRISTGKPFTPITGSFYDSTQNVYVPVSAVPNSGRFPVYQRWDMNLQYTFSLFHRFTIAVFQISNIINHKNLYGYSYNSDYTKQIPIYSTNRRSVYFALGMAF